MGVCIIQLDIAVGVDEIGAERVLEAGLRHDEAVNGLADAELRLGQRVLGVIEIGERAASHIVGLGRDVIGLLRLKEAQEEAARLYGSDACFFSVNGTTGAIHAMLLAALQPGDKVLVPRNAHRSVMGGLILADAVPVYAQPVYIKEFGLQGQVTPEQVKEAFALHPDIKAVLLTSPDYFGMAAEVKQIAEIAHAHNAVLLVDEAHGPHLGFHDKFPPSAMQCGADMAAQSTHKILGALTQCSLLQVKGTRVNLRHVEDVMSLLTTTSPNYLLMGSLDAARAQLAERGSAMMEDALRAAGLLRHELEKITGLRVIKA